MVQQHTIALLPLLLMFSLSGHALPTDKDQPVEINSDSAELRDKDGYAVYSGNVKMTQGSLEIDAERIELFFPDKELTRAIIYGGERGQAYFQQAPKTGEKLVRGSADRIIYQIDPDEIRLLQNAVFCQKGSEQKGMRIIYDIEKDIMRAKARTKTVFRPDNVPGSCEHIRSAYR